MTETMRRVEALADLLARECPLRELLGAIRETEGEMEGNELTFTSEASIRQYLRRNDLEGAPERELYDVAGYIWANALSPDNGKTVFVEIERRNYQWSSLQDMIEEAVAR